MTQEERLARTKEKQKEWRKNNPDKVKAIAKRYREKHREEIRKKDRERYASDGGADQKARLMRYWQKQIEKAQATVTQ